MKELPMSDLASLLEKVRSAKGADRGVDARVHHALFGLFGAPRYTASIDAALALVERKLPGFDYILEHTNGGLTISCMLGTADPDKRCFGETPALAILAAMLTALITQETPNQGETK